MRRDERGQSLVELTLALIPFLFLTLGIVDLGRAIYTNNGVAQAAREIARAAIVHPCTGPCTSATWSAEIQDAVATQRQLVPGLTDAGVAIACSDFAGNPVVVGAGGICPPGDFVKVTTTATFQPVTPLLPIPRPLNLGATAHIQVP
jgi:hypothetical protein